MATLSAGKAPAATRASLVVSLAVVAASCASVRAPAATAPALPDTLVTTEHPVAGDPIVMTIDPVIERLSDADEAFDAGVLELQAGRLQSAREHFDAAIDLLLAAPDGARSDPRLAATFDRLLDRISALDLIALREADGAAESDAEPAAIDALLEATTFERPRPLDTTEATVLADLARTPPVFPVAVNEKVLSYVELYQGRLNEFMQAGLNRGQRYLPMIDRIFAEEEVPPELAFVPLVESAFKPTALSRASARGMWQFMLGTAREHDLEHDWFIDERGDPEKATRAAARYLRTLHDMFGDWSLALAAYNGGPGRVQRAMRRANRTDYWALTDSTRYLPRETREYVPMVMAAMIIARSPALYGFTVGPAAPLTYETVTVPKALDLRILAEWAGVPVDELRELNPQLRRTTTPMDPYALRVPIGTSATVSGELAGADPSLFLTLRVHLVKRGDTLGAIARRYRVTVADIQTVNQLRTTRIYPNQGLMIPERGATALPAARPAPAAANTGPVIYRVRRGDTLSRIARAHGTTVTALKQLNQLAGDRIRVGDRLTVRR